MKSHLCAWLLVTASVAAEVVGTIALRFADGLTRPTPSLIALLLYSLATWLMSLAARHLAIGVVYAVWAGSAIALTALLGIIYFGEDAPAMRLVGFGLIALGVAALHLSST